MKNLLMWVLILAPVKFVHSQEVRFEPEFEKKCLKEIHRLKCGDPDKKGEEAFMKCVDSKISKLSPGCQDMHKQVRAVNHSQHAH